MSNPAPRDPREREHARLDREDAKIDRCPRCGAWRYAKTCTGACPVLHVVAQ